MSAATPGQALADAWDAQALKCDEAAALPGLAKAAVLEQATFAAQLRDCARQLREMLAAAAPPAPDEAAGPWTAAELAAALDGFYGWFTVPGGTARVQGQLLGADAGEFARALHAHLDSGRAHREDDE